MELMDKSTTQALTEPYHEVWARAHLRAWDLWQDRLLNDPEFFKPFTAGDRYLILHRHICEFAANELDGAVQTPTHLDFFAQVITDKLLVRFKHLDGSLKPKNYPTEQQEDLSRQVLSERIEEQLRLDGIGAPLQVLTVGYTLTPAEDAMSQIVSVCHTPELYFWYPILGEAGEGYGDGGEIPGFPTIDRPGPRVTDTRITKKSEGQDG